MAEEIKSGENETPVPPKPVTNQGIETGVFGKWASRLRNLCGLAAVITVCFNSILYVWTTHVSVSAGHGWPDRTSLLIITCGPIIVAFTFMDSSKILRILSQTSGIGDTLRKKVVTSLHRTGDLPQETKKETP